MKTLAAVVREPGGPFLFEELELEKPRQDEVLVRLVATGLCHADLLVRNQDYPVALPAVLGHEGAGVVEGVGSAVTDIEVGDHVVLTGDSCGRCKMCDTGHPSMCEHLFGLNFSGFRPDGSTSLGGGVAGRFFGQSSLATHCIAAGRSAVKVPKDVPLENLGPLGCGVRTGAGAVFNTLAPAPGDSIAVFGVGSVGMSALLAARLAACGTTVAVDVVASRLDLACELGATHAVDASTPDLVDSLRAITGGRGLDHAVEASGRPEILRAAVDALNDTGTCVVLGGPPLGTEASFDVTGILLGRTIKGAPSGDTAGPVVIPQLIDLQRAGLFPFERLIATYEFAQLNEAVADVERGEVIKAVLKMPQTTLDKTGGTENA